MARWLAVFGSLVGAGALQGAWAETSSGEEPAAANARAAYEAGAAAFGADEFSQAQTRFEEAAGLFHSLGMVTQEAISRYNMGMAAARLGDTASAAAHVEQAIELLAPLRSLALEGEWKVALGELYGDLGRTADAVRVLEEARLCRRQSGEPDQLADCERRYGGVLAGVQDYAASVPHIEAAARIYRRLGRRREEAACRRELAGSFHNLGDYAKAVALWRQGLALWRPEDGRAEQAENRIWLAQDLRWLGAYDEAISLLGDALAVCEQDALDEQRVICLDTLGTTYCLAGQASRAVPCLEEAVETAKKLKMEDYLSYLNNLGLAYSYVAEQERALKCYEDLAREQDASSSPRAAAVLQLNIGDALMQLGRAEEALGHVELARSLVPTDLATRRVDAECCLHLAMIHTDLSQYDAAISSALEASRLLHAEAEEVASRGPSWVPEELYRAEALLGKAYRRRGQARDWMTAYRHLARATVLADWLRTHGSAGLRSRMSYFGQLAWVYDEMSAVLDTTSGLAAPFESDLLQEDQPRFWTSIGLPVPRLWHDDWHGVDEALLYYSESARARVLRDMLLSRRVGFRDRREQRRWDRVAALAAQEAKLSEKLVETPEAPNATEIQRQHERVRAERERTEAEMGRTLLGQFAGQTQISTAEWRAMLEADEAIVEYKIVEDGLIVFLLTGSQLRVLRVRLQPPEGQTVEYQLEGLAAVVRHPMAARGRGESAMISARQHLGTLAQAYDWLLRPIEKHADADGIRHLMIVPDGPLHNVPFGLLVEQPLEDGGAVDDPSCYADPDVRYALDRWDISYLPSIAAHAALCRLNALRRVPGRRLCAFADPVFSGKDERLEGSGVALELAMAQTPKLALADPVIQVEAGAQGDYLRAKRTDLGDLNRLPFTSIEMDQALAAFGGTTGSVVSSAAEPPSWGTTQGFSGVAALESRLYDQRLENYGYILLSTHGIIDEEEPLYSYLAFTSPTAIGQSGSGEVPPQADGRLTFADLFGLPLNARVVTLSGCRTGLGKLERGEGLMGLSLALFCAGARSVAATLWPVDDARTATLVGRYHQLMAQGDRPLHALCTAQREMLNRARETSRSGGLDDPELSDGDPFYWSPFVLIGDG